MSAILAIRAYLLNYGQRVARCGTAGDRAGGIKVNDPRLVSAVADVAGQPDAQRRGRSQVPDKTRRATCGGVGHIPLVSGIDILIPALLVRRGSDTLIDKNREIASRRWRRPTQNPKSRWIAVAVGNPVGYGRRADGAQIRHGRRLIRGHFRPQHVRDCNRRDDQDDGNND